MTRMGWLAAKVNVGDGGGRLLSAVFALLTSVVLTGCSGYRLGSVYDTGVRTIAVPMFENQTFANGLEASLTEAIITEVHSTTPWRVVPEAQAQTTLEGAITEATLRTLATEGGFVEQSAYVMTVDFAWRDNARGDAMVVRRGFTSAGTFVPALGVQEPIEIGQREAISELARDIVAELASEW